MEIGVRELRNETARVIEAVRAGEQVTLTVRGEAVADIVPRADRPRPRSISGEWLREQLATRQADPALRDLLDELAGDTTDDLRTW